MQGRQSAIALLLFDNSEPDLQLVNVSLIRNVLFTTGKFGARLLGEQMAEGKMGAIHQKIYALCKGSDRS